jgi:hypothetical protein
MNCSYGTQNQYAALYLDYFCHKTYVTEVLARVVVSGTQKMKKDIFVHIRHTNIK